MAYKYRWGKVDQIDKRTRVGTPAWFARHTKKIQLLSAWRNLHRLGSHGDVSAATVHSPSSDMPLDEMIRLGKNAEEIRKLGFTDTGVE